MYARTVKNIILKYVPFIVAPYNGPFILIIGSAIPDVIW